MSVLHSVRLRWISAAGATITLVLGFGLFLVNPTASVWFGVGVGAALGIGSLAYLWLSSDQRTRTAWAAIGVLVATTGAVVLWSSLTLPDVPRRPLRVLDGDVNISADGGTATSSAGNRGNANGGNANISVPPLPTVAVVRYEVHISTDGEAGLVVSEEVTIEVGRQGGLRNDAGAGLIRSTNEGEGISPSGRILSASEGRVHSTPATWALLKADIRPLVRTGGRVVVDIGDVFGRPVARPLCSATCPATRVHLRDFPAGRFMRPDGVSATTVPASLDTEHISWTTDQPDEGIVFYYYREPYHFFRPVIDRFATVASLGDVTVLVLGLGWAIATAGFAVFIGLTKDWICDRFKSGHRLARRPKGAMQATSFPAKIDQDVWY